MNRNQKFIRIVLLLFLVLFISITGYMYILHLNFLDALYMTVITISTVGYGEVGTMTPFSKVFTILIIFLGLSIFGYVVTSFFSFFFEGNLKNTWRKRKMDSKIAELDNHYIICGAGDVGRAVMKSFCENNISFIVIDENKTTAEELQEQNILTVCGDAAHEDILEKSGIIKAKGIVCCLPTDVENVFTVLTARQMNPNIYIVSKAIENSAHNKLAKAGANKTISPNEIGGQRIAALLMHPSVVSFLDVITRAGDVTLDLEEVVIPTHSTLVGKMLMEARLPEQTGLIVIALKKRDTDHFIFNPSSNELLEESDTMIVLGNPGQVKKLEEIVQK